MESTLQSTNPGVSDRHWAAAAHFSALALALATSWFAGVAGVVGAGVIYLIKRDDSPFATEHAREAINFNLSMFVYMCLAIIIGLILFGATLVTLGLGLILTLPAALLLAVAMAGLAVMWVVCSVIAGLKAWNGEHYRYPLTIRLI